MMAATVRIQDCIEEPLLVEWERLAQQVDASPFLWPGWMSAWWRAFGTGRLQILTAYRDGNLTGVLPLHLSRGTLSSTTNLHTPLFGFLAENETAMKQLTYELFSQRVRRINLSYLAPTGADASLTRTATDVGGYRVRTEFRQEAPYVATDNAWDEYEARLRRKFRSELRRRRRRLEEEGQLTLEVHDGTERLDELLAEGFRVEGLGWKSTYGTSINSHPATRRFYTEVAYWASDRRWLRLAFLRLNGKPLAFDYCLECNKTHYLLKTGYDPTYRKLAPGMVMRYLMLARVFFSDGFVVYDFLGEDQPWKQEWSNMVQKRAFLYAFAPTPLGFLDRMVFAHGRPASKRAKSLIRSIVGARGVHMLKRGRALGERLSR
jgi:CelD/BcsL family acetyltransferase involved in cellulose biosynthesis